MDRLNVFLLVIDSLRADATYGDHIVTKNFDDFAARGATFQQCIATATTTTPSFSSMLTGCYPPRHGVRGLQGYRLSPSLQTLAEAFSAAGYSTYAEVTGPLLPETGILRGFEHANHRQAYKVPFFGWRDDVIARIKGFAEPWFFLLHIWEVHRPYRSPPDFAKRKDRAGYEAAVAATDEYLGPVFDAVDRDSVVLITGDHGEDYPEGSIGFQMVRVARRARRTFKLAKWFSYLDNKFAGMEIGHGFALYEHLIRVPLIMSGPGIAHAQIADQVRHIDLLPTLVDLLDLQSTSSPDGRSLRPLLDGGDFPEEPAYMEAVGVKLGGNRVVGARTPDWKLIRPPRGKPALYKIDGDGEPVDERRNLYARYPEIARRLEDYIETVEASETESASPLSAEEEAVVEQHLRDLGYL